MYVCLLIGSYYMYMYMYLLFTCTNEGSVTNVHSSIDQHSQNIDINPLNIKPLFIQQNSIPLTQQITN